ncbi:hypothetical protein FRAHR75_1790007 [Frankia sp. Hr75.2]|nr:hypothetical protein FRAHR75_1790007 [Frankia sp. Hr75.2]
MSSYTRRQAHPARPRRTRIGRQPRPDLPHRRPSHHYDDHPVAEILSSDGTRPVPDVPRSVSVASGNCPQAAKTPATATITITLSDGAKGLKAADRTTFTTTVFSGQSRSGRARPA